MRMGSKPGSRISLGTQDKTVGYDVTYRYAGTEQTIRMDQKPGDRPPVIDGQLVPQTAAWWSRRARPTGLPAGKDDGPAPDGPFFGPCVPACAAHARQCSDCDSVGPLRVRTEAVGWCQKKR